MSDTENLISAFEETINNCGDSHAIIDFASAKEILSALKSYEDVLAGHRRLVRELDVLLNGEDGAAKQASLCDIVGQVAQCVRKHGQPLLFFIDYESGQ